MYIPYLGPKRYRGICKQANEQTYRTMITELLIQWFLNKFEQNMLIGNFEQTDLNSQKKFQTGRYLDRHVVNEKSISN